jgi:hypothetical protein
MSADQKIKHISQNSPTEINTKLGKRWTPPKSNSPITLPAPSHLHESQPPYETNLFKDSRPTTPSKLVLIIPHTHIEELDCDSTAFKVILPDTTMTLTTLAPTHILQLGTDQTFNNHRFTFPSSTNPMNDTPTFP